MRLLESKVEHFALRREVEDELALISFGQQIAALRKRRGLTQAALAKRTDMSQPMIAQIESGKANNLTPGELAKTAIALNASLKVDLIPRSTLSHLGGGLRKVLPKDGVAIALER